jgi:hypothetical protein
MPGRFYQAGRRGQPVSWRSTGHLPKGHPDIMTTAADSAIDLYCERTSADFWAEPVNALSNLSFVIAALAIVVLLRRTQTRAGAPAVFLIVNLAAIGVGSFLFDTFANRLTMLADLLPIFVYQLAFLIFYARGVAGCRWSMLAGLLLLFALVNAFFLQLPAHWLNGSLLYGGALLFIVAIAAYHRASGRREPMIVALAAGIFVLSLSCRSVDQWLCAWAPVGSHFIWHLLNGIVLYLTTLAYVLNQPPPHP